MFSSVRGRIPTIFGSAYNITKYGLEVFSDILRLEMKKFGVTVCVVQPCSFGGATQTMVNELFCTKQNIICAQIETIFYIFFVIFVEY